MKKLFGIVAAIAALAIQVSAANTAKAAFNIALANTGVNVVGDVDQSYDYTFNAGPSADARLQNPVHANWIPNSADSKWITSTPGVSQPAGLYVFSTVFNLPIGTLLDTVQITGRWATDNGGVMKINGQTVTTGSVSPGGAHTPFGTWTSFSILDFFQIGNNTITFEVTNDPGSSPNPTGLRVEMSGTYATPEPTTLVVWGGLAAIGGVVAYRRRIVA